MAPFPPDSSTASSYYIASRGRRCTFQAMRIVTRESGAQPKRVNDYASEPAFPIRERGLRDNILIDYRWATSYMKAPTSHETRARTSVVCAHSGPIFTHVTRDHRGLNIPMHERKGCSWSGTNEENTFEVSSHAGHCNLDFALDPRSLPAYLLHGGRFVAFDRWRSRPPV